MHAVNCPKFRSEDRISALIKLNKVNLPGALGRQLNELVKYINGFYCKEDGTIIINNVDDESLSKLRGIVREYFKQIAQGNATAGQNFKRTLKRI